MTPASSRAEVAVIGVKWRSLRFAVAGTGAAIRLGPQLREGTLLQLTWSGPEREGSSATSLGEACPLPVAAPRRSSLQPLGGLSAATARAPQRQVAHLAHLASLASLASLARALVELPERERRALDDVDGCAALARELAAPWPALRFALETALLGAMARRREVSLAQLLCASAARRVAVNAVVGSAAEASAAWARGVSCFKVKLGADTAADARLLCALREGWPTARLRGDANGQWPAAEVAARLSELAPAGLEYVEEPCANLAAELARGVAWPVPVALDESALTLDEQELTEALGSPQVAALVVKPTCAGGLTAGRALAALAARCGKPTVTTHALEGPVAFAACAELARALAPTQPGGGDLAVGLDHHPGLAAWPVAPPQLTEGAVCQAGDAGLGLEQRGDELFAFASRDSDDSVGSSDSSGSDDSDDSDAGGRRGPR
ncbi:MAG: hypothetical protein IPI49_24635 [Myxococcales bacterium]|nr:hypothetical protein [Myxococcales bacterium]